MIRLCVLLLLVSGCSILPVQHSDGHWALLENPLSNKCVEVYMQDGSLEVGGIASWISNITLKGKGIYYRSYGRMCEYTDKYTFSKEVLK